MTQKFEHTVLDMIESAARVQKTAPLNLGGTGGLGGGVGAPPGGFIGQLPQYRVAYDMLEDATLDTLPSGVTGISGWSLVDNLNHIRYRLGVIESGGVASSGITVVDDNTPATYAGTTSIHFVGSGVIVTDLGGGEVQIEINATGTGSGSGASTFLELTDTPSSYVGQGGKYVVVNAGATALEFATVPSGGLSDAPSDGDTYGRKDGAWVTVSGLSASDNIVYASTVAALNTDLISGGGTDDTAALQAVLNTASSLGGLTLVMDGPALVSGLNIYSNTTIKCLPGAGFYLKNGSNRAIIRNANRSRTTITDEHISLIGGYYNGNKDNQSGGGPFGTLESDNTFMSPIQLFGVNHILVRDLEVVNGNGFSINIANSSYYTVENYRFDAGSNPVFTQDGVHLNGPCYYGYIHNVRGKSWDDAIAVNAGDDSSLDLTISNIHGPYIGQGPIVDLVVDGVILNECRTGIRLLNHGINARIHRVKIMNVTGTVIDEALILGSELVGTSSIGDVLLENLSIVVSEPTAGHENALMLINGSAENLKIKNLSVYSPVTDRNLIWVSSTASLDVFDIDGFTIYDTDNDASGMIPILVDGAISKLNISKFNWIRNGVTQASKAISLENAASSIGTIVLNNLQVNLCNNILSHTDGTLDYIQAVGIRHETSNSNPSFYTTGTVNEISLSNWYGYDPTEGTFTVQTGDAFFTVATITVADSSGTPTITGVDTIKFAGVTVANLGGGDALVTFSGVTPPETLLHYYNDDLTTQVPNTIFSTSKIYESGTLRLFYNGVRQRKGVHYVDDINFTIFSTYFATYSGDSIIVDYDYYESNQVSNDTLKDSNGIVIVDSDGNILTE